MCDPERRLRLENYAYFEEGMQTLARRARVLGFFRQDAAEKKESALLVYIQQQLEYAKIWKLLEFSQVSGALQKPCMTTLYPACIEQAVASRCRIHLAEQCLYLTAETGPTPGGREPW